MADPARARRLARRINTIVASAIEFEIKDPGLAGVTIVDTTVTAEGEGGGRDTVTLPITSAPGAPSIAASPSPAYANQIVTVTGTRFTPGETVDVTWPGTCSPPTSRVVFTPNGRTRNIENAQNRT